VASARQDESASLMWALVRSPGPARAVIYESSGQERREDLSGLSHGLSTNIAALPPWLTTWRTVRRCFGR
jgi:hypothetical protein